MTSCPHQPHEMDSACADGLCPLCLSDQVTLLRADLIRSKAASLKAQSILHYALSHRDSVLGSERDAIRSALRVLEQPAREQHEHEHGR
jgi:hypothetical protein